MLQRYSLIIGNSNYSNQDEFPTIPYAKNDACHIYDLLTDSKVGIFSRQTSKCRTDVTRDDMDDVLDEFFENVSYEDLVLIYFAGHATVLPGGKRLFLAMADTNPNKIARSAFNVDNLLPYFEERRINKYIVILDCCRSGKALKSADVRHRGLIHEVELQNLSGQGKIFIASSQEYQPAYELETLNHGLFSYYFIDGIKSGASIESSKEYIDIVALNSYVQKEIKKRHPDISQEPEISGVDITGDLFIARNPQWSGSKQYSSVVEHPRSNSHITNLEQCRSDILFLVVGNNILAHYMSALLLAADAGNIHILCPIADSDNGLSSAELLQKALYLKRPNLNITITSIHNADSRSIRHQIDKLVKQTSMRGAIGIIYSKDTQGVGFLMHSVLDNHPSEIDSLISGYLGLDRAALFVDGALNEVMVDRWPLLSFEDLGTLHGYSLVQFDTTSRYPHKFHQAMIQVYSTVEGAEAWQNWLTTRPSDFAELSRHPTLQPIIDVFDELCDGSATAEKVAHLLGRRNFTSCRKIFMGEWLEDFIFKAILEIAPQFGIDNCRKDLVISFDKRIRFEIDVAAILDYRFLLFFCTTAWRNFQIKAILYEAQIRAQQLGGNDAQILLVTCAKNSDRLQQETTQGWQQRSDVTILGREHLPNLKDHLFVWLNQIQND